MIKNRLNMKFNDNNLRKVQIVTDCVMIAISGAGIIISLSQDQYRETLFHLMLVLAWLLILMKDLDIKHYAKLVDLYKELERKQDEYINFLIGVLHEKQKDDDTDTDNQ